MAYTESGFDPEVAGFVVMKNGTKVVGKKRLKEGKESFGNVRVPTEIAFGAKVFMLFGKNCERKHGNKPGGEIARFEITWYIGLDEDGKYKLLGKPVFKKVNNHIFMKMEVEPFDMKGLVGFKLNVDIDFSGGKRDKFTKVFKFGYGIETMSQKEKLTEFKASRISCVACAVGEYPEDDANTRKVKKKKSDLDWAGFRKWYNGLPQRTQDIITNDMKPGGKKIELIGYADTKAGSAANDKLGQQRAENVRDWIKTWSGCSSNSIFACKGKGGGKSGSDKSRRVTVSIMAER